MQTRVAPSKSEDIQSLEYGTDFFTRNWICQNYKETSQHLGLFPWIIHSTEPALSVYI